MKTNTRSIALCKYLSVLTGLLLLTGLRARADYNSTVMADSPLAFYALNPGQDGTNDAPDLSGNGNDGAPYGIATATGPSAFITNAAAFDGATSLIDLSDGNNPDLLNFSGPITLEAWAQPSSTGEFGDVLAKGYNASTYQEIVIRVNGPYGGNYYASSGSSGQSGGTQTTTWSHIVLSSDGTNCSLYINGALVSQGGDTSGSQTFINDWIIGDGSGSGNTRFFGGNISEVAIYNYGLSAKQVQTHYLMGMYGTTNLTANNLRWSANANTGIWDDITSPNWVNTANSQETNFNFGDNVLFDDTTGVPTSVTVNGSVSPTTLTVNSSTNNFNFSGTGALAGSGGIIKNGSSTLTISTPGHPTGPVYINGGEISAGNNCFRYVASIGISNNATLDLAGGNLLNNTPVTVSGNGVGGGGAIINSYNDDPGQSVNVTMTGDTKFGAANRWDLNSGSSITGPHNLDVDWSAGAGYGQWNSVTIGASVESVTVTNSSTLGLTGMDTACQNTATVFNIYNQLVLYSGGFNGSLNLEGGSQLVVYSGNVNLGGSALHVYGGATMYLYAQGIAMTGSSLIFESGSSMQTYYNSGNNPIANQVTFNGVAHFVLGDHSMTFNNTLGGAGGFVLDYYGNEMILTASNSYSGPTIIGNNGNTPEVVLTGSGSISQSSLIFFGGNTASAVHLDATGRTDGTLTLASGQTLGGIGAVNGNLTVSSGATIAPAGTNTTISITTGSNPTGTLAASGTVTLGGTTLLKLGATGVNDQIASTGSIALSGALSLVNISGGSWTAGSSYQILNAAGYSGSFASISPAAPGANLVWDTSHLNTTGVLNVVAVQPFGITSTTVSGGHIVISGANGLANTNFYLLATTNIRAPLTNWTVLSTNMTSGTGTFSVTNAVTPGAKQQFFTVTQ